MIKNMPIGSIVSPVRRALPLMALLPLLLGTSANAKGALEGVIAVTASGSGALLVAEPHALFIKEDDEPSFEQVRLPARAREARIAAIGAAAEGRGVWYIAAPGLGVLRTSNQGATWKARNEGLPSLDAVALAAHSTDPETVYVYVAKRGIFRSQDGGKHWKLMDGGPREPLAQFVHSNMPGSMQTGWLFAATETGVARSMDCFCGWYDAGGLNAKAHAVAYDPGQSQHVYAATEKGLFLSANGGEEWTRVNSPAPRVTALAVMTSGALYAASEGRLFRSTDGAKTWKQVGA